MTSLFPAFAFDHVANPFHYLKQNLLIHHVDLNCHFHRLRISVFRNDFGYNFFNPGWVSAVLDSRIIRFPLVDSIFFGPVQDLSDADQACFRLVCLVIVLQKTPPREVTGSLIDGFPVLLLSQLLAMESISENCLMISNDSDEFLVALSLRLLLFAHSRIF